MLGIESDPERHPLLSVLRIEPISDPFTPQWLHTNMRRLKAAIRTTLMDSHRIVGVGNIYASESLFRAAIDPRAASGKISPARFQIPCPASHPTLRDALRAVGSSLRAFIHSAGRSGYFQLEGFVYGRNVEACRVCGGVIKTIRQGQRATFYCAAC